MRALIAFFLCTTLWGSIVEIDHFSQVPGHVKPGTLLILDIDDTLIVPAQMLGCDEWFQARRRHYLALGWSYIAALEKSLAEWEAVRHLTEMRLCEPGADLLVKKLQDEGRMVMGLTTQGLALATRSQHQLQALGIDLRCTCPSQNDHYFNLNGHGVLYRHGIFFTSGQPKGEALFSLLDALELMPKQIVFVNDKEAHLQEVKIVAEKRAIAFTGLRYAYSDAQKEAFSPTLANFQFTHSSFAHILTDEEAKTQMEVLCSSSNTR